MGDAIDRARASRGALERLGARVPGFAGYLERELRREMDQRLRGELAFHIDRARDAVLRQLARLDPGSAVVGRLAGTERLLDLCANRVRHAGSGYAGMFDAAKVREDDLEALYRFDEALLARVDMIVGAASSLTGELPSVATLEDAVSALEVDLARRDGVVRSAFAVAP